MRNVRRIMGLPFFIGFLAVRSFFVSCESKFTGSDLNVIGKYFSSDCLVFVENGEDVGLVRRIKSLGSHTYVTAVNSSHLEKILSNNVTQLNFLQRRTTIVTKENLNLTLLVNWISSPHFLTWVIFRDLIPLPGLYIPFSNKVFFVHNTPEAVSVKQVYHLKNGVNATVAVPDWQGTPNQRWVDLRGINIDMIFLTPREACKSMHTQRLLKKLECVHWDFIEIMAEIFNFSLNPVECIEKNFPYTFPNKSESELLLKLRHRKVDLASIGYIVSARRHRSYLDIVWPTFRIKSRMYLKQWRLRGRWASYLKPLQSSVWWGILMYVVIFGILLQIFEKLLSNTLKLNGNFVLELIMSILRALQVFCNQAIPDLSTFYSIRMIYFFEFFVVLIFFQAYCGYLVSSLTVVASRFPFLDLKGFFASPQYRIMTLRKGFHQFYFREIVGKGPREYLLPPEELPDTIQQAVDKLCADNHLAFTEFREDLLDFDTLTCKITELPAPLLHLFVGIVMPTGAPLKEFLKREVLTLRSAGIIKKHESRLSSQADFRDKRTGDDFSSVSMSQIFSVFILLWVGILLSLLICLFEVMLSWNKRRMVPLLKKRKKK